MRAQVACAGGSFSGAKRTCRLRLQDQVWSNGAGRGVVVPAYTVTFEVVDHDDHGTAECGGRAVTGDSASSTAPGVISYRGSFHSDGDDASAVELAPQQGLWVGGFADACSEVTGSWRGIAGDLEHRAGTFTMITNSLQTELHLIEE
jgi:hypothetical protein